MTIKMGFNNPVTAERFHKIKGALASGMNSDEVMRQFNIRKTTLGRIRKADTFYEYRLLNERSTTLRAPIIVVQPDSGVAYEDYGPGVKQKQKRDERFTTHRLDLESDRTAMWLGILLGVMTIVVSAIAIVALLV